MSMIEKFLKGKEEMHKQLDAAHAEATRIFDEKSEKICNAFVDQFKEMVMNASNEEFAKFISSNELDKPDVIAAIVFRADVAEAESESDDKPRHAVHVIVVD